MQKNDIILAKKIIPEGKDKWDIIDNIILDFVKLYPTQMFDCFDRIREARKVQLNKYASTPSMSLRWGMELPQGLMVILKRWYPEIFTKKKEYHKFIRRYPQFRIADVL